MSSLLLPYYVSLSSFHLLLKIHSIVTPEADCLFHLKTESKP